MYNQNDKHQIHQLSRRNLLYFRMADSVEVSRVKCEITHHDRINKRCFTSLSISYKGDTESGWWARCILWRRWRTTTYNPFDLIERLSQN
jgi:hypothetical protein